MKTLFSLLAALVFHTADAKPSKDSSDIFIIQQLKQKAISLETERAIFWFDSPITDSVKAKGFAQDVTDGIKAIEEFTGTTFDAEYYGTSKIEYFVSDYTTVSHVYHGYHHNAGKSMPYIFFSAKRFKRDALPYLHETTHLILRDFHSLWLREGMAEFVAKQVAKQAGKGHIAFYGDEQSSDVHQLAAGIEKHSASEIILNTIGKNGIPEFKNTEIRRMFYIGSTSFVDYLSCFITKERLLQLYAATDTKETLEKMMGKTIDEIKLDWQAATKKI